jgi:hypothetical protein
MCTTEIQEMLRPTPFTFIHEKIGRSTHYTFYRRGDWDTPSRQPRPYEVLGVTIAGHSKALCFTKGLTLGYAQRKLIIKKS